MSHPPDTGFGIAVGINGVVSRHCLNAHQPFSQAQRNVFGSQWCWMVSTIAGCSEQRADLIQVKQLHNAYVTQMP